MSQQSQTVESVLSATSPVKVARHDTKVINVGDRVFYRITQGFAIVVILLGLLLVMNLFSGAWLAIETFG